MSAHSLPRTPNVDHVADREALEAFANPPKHSYQERAAKNLSDTEEFRNRIRAQLGLANHT